MKAGALDDISGRCAEDIRLRGFYWRGCRFMSPSRIARPTYAISRPAIANGGCQQAMK
jgi:hypothetical protein